MAGKFDTLKTTIAGGILFLLPLILVLFLLGKALKVAERLSQPIVRVIGIETVGGLALGTLIGIAALVLICFLAGLLARTRLGHAAFAMVENSILAILPQWRMARGLIQGFDSGRASEVEVVLVPTDAGWCLGFVLEKPAGEWWPVFIPGSPQWTSGSVSYARTEQVHKTGMTAAQAILLMRRCGAGSAPIQAVLAALEQKNVL